MKLFRCIESYETDVGPEILAGMVFCVVEVAGIELPDPRYGRLNSENKRTYNPMDYWEEIDVSKLGKYNYEET